MGSDRRDAPTAAAAAVVRECIDAAIEAARPETVLAREVGLGGATLRVGGGEYDLDAFERVVVLGGGKAAGRMAAALSDLLGDRIDDGVVVTTDPVDCPPVTVLEGTHPVPSERNVDATERVLELAESADERTLVLAVVAGGGSALLSAPAAGLTVEDLAAVTEGLLDSGAAIDEINAVRKHLSRVKGGRLAAAAAPATVVGLVVSDVVGDDLATIASGPLTPDDTTYADALAVLERYELSPPDAVVDHLRAGADGERAETPTAEGDFERVDVHVVANAMTALEAAGAAARERGFEPLILSTRVRGESRESAIAHVAIAEEVAASGNPVGAPAALLSGGETTVTVRPRGSRPGDAADAEPGVGGPNHEFALSAALALESAAVTIGAVDTDGIDGGAETAGAIVDAGTATPREAARAALDGHDAATFLEEAGATVRTGRTGTNVNDLRVLLVEADGG